MRRFVRTFAGIALIAFASMKATAQDPVPLDAATLAALGIRSEPVPLAASAPPQRPVTPHVGPWSWTSGTYQYDGSGNITAMGSQAFAYDTQGRLIAAKLNRPDQPGSIDHTYTYDDVGNMTARTASGSNIAMTTSVSTNHLTSLSATYDAAGNLTQIQPPEQTNNPIYQYTYDALGAMQMAKVSSMTGETRQVHVYTADDERIWTYDMGEGKSRWKIRDLSGKVLRDFQDDGTTWTVQRDYIYRNGLLLAAVTPTKTLHYSLDHLGSPRVITDENRHRVGFHHYFPFGLEWTDNSGVQEGERQKFTGHERDRDPAGGLHGIDYMHARYYSPGIARFLSVDKGQATYDRPQSWNRYAYVESSPLARVDPDGNTWYAVIFQQRFKNGMYGKADHEAIVWIDRRGYGQTWEHPLGHSEYVGPYAGSWANTVSPYAKLKLHPTRFRNLGQNFDPKKARARGVGADVLYKRGSYQCTTYCAKMIGDPVKFNFFNFLAGVPSSPTTEDRMSDERYVPGVMMNGTMWPADLAGSVGYSNSRTSTSPLQLALPTDGGANLYCVDGVCR